ncbi:MAG: hypothetical protein EXS37_07740 [Opitutus sp.]|nr:hypothetical protein [Opitutus sp.]
MAALPIVEIGQRTESEIFIMRATYQAFAKEKAAARQSAEKALELMPVTRSARDGPAALARAAVVHVLLGEPDRALALLDQALSVPSTLLLVGHPDFEPLWAPLRQDPRYRAALAKAAPRD